MINNLIKVITISVILGSCVPKYEVIQQLAPNKYHLQGVKNQEVIIVITDTPLKEGELTTLKVLKKSNGHFE